MKNIIIFLFLISSLCIFGQDKLVMLDQVALTVKTSSFKILEHAQQVYNAKEMINFSKINLLSKLNVWNVLKLPLDWASAIDIVQDIAPFLVPNISELEPIVYEDNIKVALRIFPEIKQYTYLQSILKKIRQKITFYFLGSPTTAGGYFNNLPIQDGLGFGMGSSIRISKREGHIIDLNLMATTEVIKENLYLLTYNFNSMLDNYDNQSLRLELAQAFNPLWRL
jgi:hypothetical protein